MIESEFMGQITIEVPQRIKRSYRITDRKYAQKLLADLENSDVSSESVYAEDLKDIRQAKKSLAEFERTGESFTVNELREELGL